MKIARYLLIATLAGTVVAVLLWWQRQPPALPATSPPAATTATASERQPVTAPPTTPQHRKARQSLAALVRLPSEFEQNARLYQIALTSSPDELAVLLDEANLLAEPEDRHGATQILLLRLIELEPESALERAARLNGTQRTAILTTLYRSWLDRDIEAAVQHLQRQPKELRLQVAAMLSALNQQYPDRNYAGVLARLALSSDGDLVDNSALVSKAGTDPIGAWRDALARPNLRKRSQALHQVVQIWAASDPQAALSAINALPPNLRLRLQMAAITRWLHGDPEAAFEWIRQQPPGLASSQMHTMAVSQIARTDMNKALSLANSLPEPLRRQTIDQALSRLARSDPARALRELRSADLDLSTSRTYAQVLSRAELFSFPESLGRAELLSPEQRQSVQQQLFRRRAGEDPATAAQYLSDIDSEQLRRQASQQLVRQWAEVDPAAAADWIATRPEDARDPLRTALISAAGNIDPVATIGQLAQIQSAELHDQSAMRLLSQLTFDLPAADRVLQQMRTDHGRRQGEALLHRVLSRLGAPEAARYRSGTVIEGQPGQAPRS